MKENMADTSVAAKSVHKQSPKPTTVSHGSAKISVDGEIRSENGESCRNRAVADKWKILLLPQFQGIDERADEFIAKFRNDMKLEREQQQSIREFEEMLNTSA
ncbi:hypothetical protein SASPL_114390 [Salvia splendens]|uniref:Uncharacterized protein n=1 Tax=Salvia splendens TaxID=180675 RepID=A0A8X8Y0J9_SALSN|nr:hypothetical protein SASPL_114390 [Salvia splendens]